MDQRTTLCDYLNEGVDRFGFENQLEGWLNSSPKYPVLVAEYDTIWGNLEEMRCCLLDIRKVYMDR